MHPQMGSHGAEGVSLNWAPVRLAAHRSQPRCSMPDLDPRIATLDGIARELALEAGYDAALRLMLHFGGQRHYIPDKIRRSSQFWQKLGPDIARVLPLCAARLGGSNGRQNEVDIPTGSRLDRAMRKTAIANFRGSKNQAAAAFHVSRRTVQRYRSKAREPTLFDLPK